MTYKKIFIIVFVIVAAFYVFKVRGYNPFAEEVKSGNVLPLLDGKSMTLDEGVREGGAFIFIMGTWCGYCAQEVEHLKSLNDFFQSNKINILIGMEGKSKKISVNGCPSTIFLQIGNRSIGKTHMSASSILMWTASLTCS